VKSHAKATLAASTLLLFTLVLGVTLANATAPTVTIENASNVQYTTATAKGTVNPQAQSTAYRFQYITAAAFAAHADAVQSLTVSATAGTFILSFSGQSTPTLPFNSSAAEVQAALNALSSIGGVGGSVAVSGGPGDERLSEQLCEGQGLFVRRW
jgi:hypothetical protein